MEKILLTLVIVLLVLIIILICGVIFLAHKHFRKSDKGINETGLHPEIQKRIKEAKTLAATPAKNTTEFCLNHPHEVAEAPCAICEKFFCQSCLRPHKSLLFCREHHQLYQKHEWSEVTALESDPDNAETGVALVEFKKTLWEKTKIPTYLETHYKINIDGDHIETFVVLFSRKEETEVVSDQFKMQSNLSK